MQSLRRTRRRSKARIFCPTRAGRPVWCERCPTPAGDRGARIRRQSRSQWPPWPGALKIARARVGSCGDQHRSRPPTTRNRRISPQATAARAPANGRGGPHRRWPRSNLRSSDVHRFWSWLRRGFIFAFQIAPQAPLAERPGSPAIAPPHPPGERPLVRGTSYGPCPARRCRWRPRRNDEGCSPRFGQPPPTRSLRRLRWRDQERDRRSVARGVENRRSRRRGSSS